MWSLMGIVESRNLGQTDTHTENQQQQHRRRIQHNNETKHTPC